MPSSILALALVALPSVSPPPAGQETAGRELAPIELEPVRIAGSGALRGTLEVYEDRAARSGRILKLALVVLPATGPEPEPDPVFWLAGGPGQGATQLAATQVASWMRRDHDLIFVDQRGTGGSNPLRCDLAGSDDDLQGYFEPAFDAERFESCRAELERVADLRLYTTPIAMDDLDDVRAALGFERINLVGGSYGTRAALVYMRRHPDRVRTATLKGVAPIAFRNPLYHAGSAQYGLERLLAACADDPACQRAFPHLAEELEEVLVRLGEAPARVRVPHPVTGEPTEIRLSRDAFAESLRVMMYGSRTAMTLPLAIHAAHGGDYTTFARLGLQTNRGLRELLAFGMLCCVTCVEDVARIEDGDISRETDGTFLGDGRVRRQIEVCDRWPLGLIPEEYGEPVRCAAPTLVLSGTFDPVTPPRWGAEAARHLENARHVVVPAFHDIGGPCVDSLVADFLERGTVEGLDTSCVESMSLPPFDLPR